MSAIVQAFEPPYDPGAEFERCRFYIEAALAFAEGTHTIDDIREGVRTRRYHFWPGENSAAITEVLQFPRKRVFNVFLAGGNLNEIIDRMEPDFCSFARHLGCTDIAMTGRLGWEKPLKPLGWHRSAIVLTKPLEVGSTT